MDFLFCHVSVLVQGHSPHPPYTYSEEESLLGLAVVDPRALISGSPRGDLFMHKPQDL